MAADGLPNRPFPLLLPCWVSATATWHVVSMWRSGVVNHERAFPTTSRQSVYGSLYFWPCDRIPLGSTCTMLHICSCTQLVGRGVAPHSHNYCHCFGPHCNGACSWWLLCNARLFLFMHGCRTSTPRCYLRGYWWGHCSSYTRATRALTARTEAQRAGHYEPTPYDLPRAEAMTCGVWIMLETKRMFLKK